MKRFIAFGLIVFFTFSCATVPITGRKQFSLIPNSQLLPMSFSSYNEVKKTAKLSTNVEQTTMIKRVGANIQHAVERYMHDNGLGNQLAGFNWEFNLIEDDQVNAWCMPGGKVAFYTGILPICKDEKGVAVVMGHEVAHAIANHGGERMSQGMILQGLGAGLAIAMQNKPQTTQNIFMQAFGLSSTLGMLKFSRSHESESDRMGLIFMAMAGYNPSEAPVFWERMSVNSRGNLPPEFLSTHPAPETRISNLNRLMPEALKFYTPGGVASPNKSTQIGNTPNTNTAKPRTYKVKSSYKVK